MPKPRAAGPPTGRSPFYGTLPFLRQGKQAEPGCHETAAITKFEGIDQSRSNNQYNSPCNSLK